MDIKEKVFKDNGNWYKGNLHAHTTTSDGKLTPEKSVLVYKQHGYSFMCLSDHDIYTDLRDKLDSEDFITLPSVEGSVRMVDASALPGIDVEKLTDGKGYADFTLDDLYEKLYTAGEYRLLKTHHIHGILGNKAMQAAAGDKLIKNNELTPIRV